MFYDSMIAKLVVHGRDRTEALRTLRGALEEYRVVGVSTNVEFLRVLSGHEAFVAGDVETVHSGMTSGLQAVLGC